MTATVTNLPAPEILRGNADLVPSTSTLYPMQMADRLQAEIAAKAVDATAWRGHRSPLRRVEFADGTIWEAPPCSA